jgi:hypothetical protein
MIVITDHARERLKERIAVSDRKMEKLAAKALASREPVAPITNRKVYNSRFYKGRERFVRQLMGKVYIFIRVDNKFVLVTVI